MQSPITESPTSMRLAVLELAARDAAASEAEFLAALRRVVAGGRDRAAELWEAYRGGRPDPWAPIFARHAD
jgi:hypothetical protein